MILTPKQVDTLIAVHGISGIPSTANITASFKWSDVLYKQTEKPKLSVLMNLFVVANKLEALKRTVFKGKKITINSAWRSVKYNVALGGATHSYHIDGMAIDFTVDGFTPKQVQKLLDPIWNGGLEFAETWTHIDTRPTICRFDSKNHVYKQNEYFKGK